MPRVSEVISGLYCKAHAKISVNPAIPPDPALSTSRSDHSSKSSSSASVQATLNLHTNGDTEIWVQCDRTWLNLNDKIILQRGDELSDKHILFAQKLIKEQYPLVGGLFSTLVQEKCYNLNHDSVQILHCLGRHHWIAASNVGCTENSVNVYDSLFSDVDATTCTLIKNMFGGDECKISMKKVQKQVGIKDCGVFAIAFITSIVCGEDPCNVFYKQEDMRKHLFDCFEQLVITPFPRQ